MYRYPDSFDQVTLALTQSRDLDLEFLERAENTVLASAEELFRNHSFNTLLDLGCGAGRLTLKYAGYFGQVTALEPDKERLRFARNTLVDQQILNVNCIGVPLLQAELADEYFDVVLCNQVIQHIDTAMIEPMIERISRLLKKDGVLILTTSHSNRHDDFYLKSILERGEVTDVEISEQEFNGLSTNDQGILPVHYFSPTSLKNALAGFSQIEFSIFDTVYAHPMLDTVLYIGSKGFVTPQ